MNETPTLTTERLVLRPLVREDAAALFPTFADDEAMRWWSRGPFENEAELTEYLVPEKGWTGRSWAVTEREGGALVGRVAAMDRGDEVSELGFVVVKDRQGKGIGAEALAAVIRHLIGTEGVRRIYLDIDPDNAASNRLAEKLGFTLEGRLREQWRTHIGARDSLIWSLLAREWKDGGLS